MWSRVAIVVLAALVLLAAAGPAGGSHGATTEPFDFAAGGGLALATNIGFEARSGPNGEQPTGQLVIGDFVGEVFCLLVQGNRAFMLAFHSDDPRVSPSDFRFLLVEDNGEAGADRVLFGPPRGLARQCLFPLASPPFPLDGNAVVHDA
jgi:hypothetical protein